MASDPSTGAGAPQRDAAERIRQLNERIIEAARRGGQAYLDAYEKTLTTIVDYQEKAGAASPFDWVQQVVETQAGFARDMIRLSTSTARDMLDRSSSG